MEALDALASRWHPRLQRLAGHLTADREAARGVVQDVWVAIVRGLRRLDDPARFRVWVYRIVSNKCRDWIRRRALRRHAAQEQQAVATAGRRAAEQPTLAETDETAELRAALRQLPDEQRAMLSLHYLDGLSVAEIADALDLPAGTVKSRLFTARLRLRKSLQERNHERVRQENP